MQNGECMRRKLIKFIVIVIVAYIAIIVLAFSIQTKLFFHPEKLSDGYKFDKSLGSQEVFLETPDGEKINALFFEAKSNKVVLYFHGNAGSLKSWQYVYEDFQHLLFNFFIIDYRGYGKSTGEISEQGLYTDAEAAYDYLLSKGFTSENIIIYGRSIGSGIAVNVAMNKNVNALILESPLSSAKKIANEKFPWLFPSFYLKYEFDNLAKINKVKSPVLIMHGTVDGVIPMHHGKMLHNTFEGEKSLMLFEGGGHNNLSEFPEFREGIVQFLK